MPPTLAQPDDALFDVDGDSIRATELAQGPWNPEHQHGGAVAGILAHVLEEHPTIEPMRIVRLSIELMRGVPVDELHVAVDELRSGRRVQLVRATLRHDGVDVAQATALKMRVDPGSVPVEPARSEHVDNQLPPPPETGAPHVRMDTLPDGTSLPGFVKAVDMSRVIGGNNVGAPSATWVRLRCQVVRGVDPSPFVRFATVGDFISGTAQYLGYGDWITINPDLTYYLWRYPTSEWIGIRGVTFNDPDGIGVSDAVFYDEAGRIGRGANAVLISPR